MVDRTEDSKCEAGCRYGLPCRNRAKWLVKSFIGFSLKVCGVHKSHYATTRNPPVLL
jgi:hypothetical protein